MGCGASQNGTLDEDSLHAENGPTQKDFKRSQSRKILKQIDDDLGALLLQDIYDELTPVENAAKLLESALHDSKVPKKVRASIAFSLKVLKLGSGRGSSAPLGFQAEISADTESVIDAEVEQWLLSQFTPDGVVGQEKMNAKKRFKAVGMSVFAAENLMRSFHQHGEEPSLPIQVSREEEQAIVAKLEGIDSWDWNIFELEAIPAARDHILEIVTWHILHRRKLPATFRLAHATLSNWLAYVQRSYRNTEYHNATHAADVVQTLHVILKMGGEAFFTDVQVLALVLSATMHDTGHDGLNNMYHKKAMTARALAFNDHSIQENYHASTVLTRMAEDETINLFIHFNDAQRTEMRRMIIQVILDTDMSKHFTMMTDFKSETARLGAVPEAWHGSLDLLMGVLLHCSDISNPAKPTDCAREWAQRVQSEFFRQGDLEKAGGLQISPNCNRETTSLPASQLGFLKYIVQPCFENLTKLLGPRAAEINVNVLNNLDFWAGEAEAGGIELHPTLARRNSVAGPTNSASGNNAPNGSNPTSAGTDDAPGGHSSSPDGGRDSRSGEPQCGSMPEAGASERGKEN